MGQIWKAIFVKSDPNATGPGGIGGPRAEFAALRLASASRCACSCRLARLDSLSLSRLLALASSLRGRLLEPPLRLWDGGVRDRAVPPGEPRHAGGV